MSFVRNKCAVTAEKDLVKLYNFKKFPVFMGVERNKGNKDKYFDMNWFISKSSGIVQLKKLIKFKDLYKKNHMSGEVGKIWEEHHLRFAKFIGNQKNSKILEIGGAHGILSKNYMKLFPSSKNWDIIEINPCPVDNVKAKYIKKPFDNSFKLKKKYNAVVHSHVLEHIYEPNKFIKKISNMLKYGESHFFSVPNIEVMLRKKYTNALNFEHTYFLSNDVIEYLMNKHGFYIIKKKYFKEDHSIFYKVVKRKNKKENKINLYKKNKKLFQDYIKFLKKDVERINKKTKDLTGVFLFGAHVFSQYLINLGLNTMNIINILDNDKKKQNKRLYGTKLYIKSPNILKRFDKPTVILRAGVYNKEILDQIKKNINPNTYFL